MKSLITGITGQDGSYLAQRLLNEGHEVHGLVRRVSNSSNLKNIEHLKDELVLHEGTLESFDVISRIISKEKYDMVFNLAAQSHVSASVNNPMETMDVNANGCIRLLESIKLWSPETKFYNSCSAEIFDTSYMCPQDETCRFKASSPYSISKISNYYTVKHYREAHSIFACQALMYNHESVLRPNTFVTKKIVQGVANILNYVQDKLVLGDLNAKRDWGYAPDYVDAIYRIISHSKPCDFVIGTGIQHTVRDIIDVACSVAGVNTESFISKYVVSSNNFVRNIEQDKYQANPAKALNELGWKATTTFEQMISKMTEAELQ